VAEFLTADEDLFASGIKDGTMLKRRATLILAITALAVGGAAVALSPIRVAGFGPQVFNDPTLNTNLSVLHEKIAWLNSPNGDLFGVAQGSVEEETFDSVAMMSNATMALGYFPSIRNGPTLDRSNGILRQVIAWQNSAAGDIFMVAQAEPMVKGRDFQRVALASIQ
jgi:hypothetical protein